MRNFNPIEMAVGIVGILLIGNIVMNVSSAYEDARAETEREAIAWLRRCTAEQFGYQSGMEFSTACVEEWNSIQSK